MNKRQIKRLVRKCDGFSKAMSFRQEVGGFVFKSGDYLYFYNMGRLTSRDRFNLFGRIRSLGYCGA